MKKVKKLVVGNWKMNPKTVAEAKKLAGEIKRGIGRGLKKTQVVVCPSYVYLAPLGNVPTNTLFLGAQDAFYEPLGAYTGEVSFSQLEDFKVGFVILGHSERRLMKDGRGESDDMINKKVRAVVGEGMTAIVCVGEATRDRDGQYLEFISGQLKSALRDVSKKSLDHLVIAYEPIWAVGAKEAETPQDIHEMTIFIKKVLRELFGVLGDSVRILYGGSTDPANAIAIVREGNVSGLLVGRESLKAKDFVMMVKEVESL